MSDGSDEVGLPIISQTHAVLRRRQSRIPVNPGFQFPDDSVHVAFAEQLIGSVQGSLVLADPGLLRQSRTRNDQQQYGRPRRESQCR